MNRLSAIVGQLAVLHILMISVGVVSLVAFASNRVKAALILSPVRVRRGEVYRLLTAGWIHGDMMHLLTNMFVLYIFADRALATFGEVAFVVFFTVAVIVAYISTAIRHHKRPKYKSLGASGGVAAVMLSTILLDPTLKLRLLFVPVPVPGVVFGALYILYSMWHSHGSKDNINHDAHFSGAAFGAIATFIWAPKQVEQTVGVLVRMASRMFN